MENIIELLFAQKENHPNKIAICDEKRQLTYSEFFDEIISLANNIASLKIINSPIIVKVDRSLNSVVAFLGILLSNNYYIPVDQDIPFEKFEKIISLSKALHYISFIDDSLPITKISLKKKNNILGYNDFAKGFDKNNYSYLMFTSGSTGVPKGVIKNHENIISFVENFLETFPFLKDERIANQTPFFFDASMKDIFISIALGATLYIPDKTRFALPLETIKYLNENKITMIYWVPSILTMIAKTRTLNYLKPEFLKYVFFVGEVFQCKYFNMWIDALPNIRYFNTYGSTEIMGVCLYHEVKNHLDGEDIPTGKALKNNKVFLDKDEIIVYSKQVACGYINIDSSNFITCDSIRGFKTGDFATYDENQNIVFSSRKDFQIKHLGYRIELQEIESSLTNLEYIDTCAALFDEIKDKIVLFVTLNKQIDNPSFVILNDAKVKMQHYMIPNKVVVLDKMPLNNNGKIDRNKLKEGL